MNNNPSPSILHREQNLLSGLFVLDPMATKRFQSPPSSTQSQSQQGESTKSRKLPHQGIPQILPISSANCHRMLTVRYKASLQQIKFHRADPHDCSTRPSNPGPNLCPHKSPAPSPLSHPFRHGHAAQNRHDCAIKRYRTRTGCRGTESETNSIPTNRRGKRPRKIPIELYPRLPLLHLSSRRNSRAKEIKGSFEVDDAGQ